MWLPSVLCYFPGCLLITSYDSASLRKQLQRYNLVHTAWMVDRRAISNVQFRKTEYRCAIWFRRILFYTDGIAKPATNIYGLSSQRASLINVMIAIWWGVKHKMTNKLAIELESPSPNPNALHFSLWLSWCLPVDCCRFQELDLSKEAFVFSESIREQDWQAAAEKAVRQLSPESKYNSVSFRTVTANILNFLLYLPHNIIFWADSWSLLRHQQVVCQSSQQDVFPGTTVFPNWYRRYTEYYTPHSTLVNCLCTMPITTVISTSWVWLFWPHWCHLSSRWKFLHFDHSFQTPYEKNTT